MAKKKKTTKKLINGKLVEMAVSEQKTFEKERKQETQISTKNEFLNRAKIDEETKEELKKLLETLPELKPVIDILIGKQ